MNRKTRSNREAYWNKIVLEANSSGMLKKGCTNLFLVYSYVFCYSIITHKEAFQQKEWLYYGNK